MRTRVCAFSIALVLVAAIPSFAQKQISVGDVAALRAAAGTPVIVTGTISRVQRSPIYQGADSFSLQLYFAETDQVFVYVIPDWAPRLEERFGRNGLVGQRITIPFERLPLSLPGRPLELRILNRDDISVTGAEGRSAAGARGSGAAPGSAGPSAGAVAQPRPPQAQIKRSPETLRGVNAMSVVLFIDGIRDISESTYRSDIESRLRAAGITVLLPTEKPRTYPYLSLTVDAAFLHAVNGNLQGSLAVFQLGLSQLFPRSVGGETVYYVGETWQTRGFVAGGIRMVADLRAEYVKAVEEFVADHRSVNGGR